MQSQWDRLNKESIDCTFFFVIFIPIRRRISSVSFFIWNRNVVYLTCIKDFLMQITVLTVHLFCYEIFELQVKIKIIFAFGIAFCKDIWVNDKVKRQSAKLKLRKYTVNLVQKKKTELEQNLEQTKSWIFRSFVSIHKINMKI